jgi:hypothetical protein
MAEDKSSKASKEDLKSVQAIRAEKERIVALNKQLADLQKALSQFSNDELQSNRQAIALSERIGSLYEEREKTIQNIRTNREQLRNLDRDELTNSSLRERYTQRQLDASERLLQTQTERRRLSSDELDKIDSITDRYDDLVDYSSKLLQNVKLRRDQEESIEGILNIAQGLSKAAADAIREGGENAEGFARAAQVGVEAISSMVDMTKAQDDAQKAALKGEYEAVDLTKQQRELRRLNNILASDDVDLSDQQRAMLQEAADRLGENIEKAQELNNVYQEISDKVKKTQEAQKFGGELLGGMFDKAKSAISRLPLGDTLIKMMKLDDIQSQVETKVGGAFNGFLEGFQSDSGGIFAKFKGGLAGMKDGFTGVGAAGAQGMGAVGGAAQGAMTAATTGAAGFGMALTAATAGVTLIIAGVMKLVSLFMEMDKEVSEMGKELGISKKEAIGVYEASADLAAEMNVVGVNAKEIGKGIKTVSESLGGIDIASRFAAGDEKIQGMVKNATILTEKFGMSGEEVGNLQGLASATGVSVEELSMKATSIGKGIFSAKENMKILASIPKTMAASFKGNVDAMIKMAQQAKLLGLDMKKIEETGRKTLDIEGSLEAEMEARVLTGKNINLDAMRYAALHNDQATVMKELVKNAGTYSEFKDMDAVQQESLAKAMNMSKEEMIDMLQKQEELTNAGLDFNEVQALQEQGSAKIREEIAKTTDAEKKKYLERLAGETESEEAAKGFSDLLEKMKGLAVKIVTPIMEMVDGMMNAKETSGGLLDILGESFAILGQTVRIVMIPLKALWNGIMKILDPIFSKLSEIFGSTKDGESGFGKISDILKGVLDIVDDIFTALQPIASFLGDTFVNIIELVANLFSGIWDIVSGIGMLFTGDIMGGLEKIGGGIINFMFSPLKFVSDQLTSIGDLAGGLIDGISNIFGGGDEEASTAASETQKAGSVEMPAGEMPKAAAGGKIEGGGLVLVGEKGPELVQLPTGASVASTGAGEQAGGIIQALGLGGAQEGGGQQSGGKGEEKTPIQQLVEIGTISAEFLSQIAQFTNQAATALTEFVYGKKDEESPLVTISDGIKKMSAGLEEFIYGKVDEETGEKGKSIFQQLIDVNQTMAENLGIIKDGINDLVILSQQASGIKLLNEEGEYKYGTETTGFEQGGVKTLPDNYEGNWVEKLTGGIFGEESTSTTSTGNGGVLGMGGGTDNSMAKVEQKLDTLINVLSAATSTPTVIKFGDKVVDEIKTQLNFRKAYTGTDIAYGKTLGN